MTRKEAFLRNGEIAFKFTSTSLYYRHKETRWYEDYTKEQMNYLWKHKYIEWSKPMTDLGEYITDMYIQFTDSGTKWR